MSKQLLGGIFAGLAVLGGIGYSLYSKGILVGGGSVPEIMSHVPDQFDQFVYFKVDTDMIDYLVKNGGEAMSGEDFRNIAKTIDSMVMYQKTDSGSVQSLLFVKDNGGFSIEKAEQLGLIPSAEGYESVKIGKNILVYGDSGSIASFENYQGDPIAATPELKKYFSDFGGYNVGFVSKPLQAAGLNPMIAQFADKLQYTQVKSKIGDKLSGVMRLQFASDTLPVIEGNIESTLMKTASAESSLVLEIKNLLKLFSVEKGQFASLAGLGLGQLSPEIASLLGSSDFETLYDILNGQMLLEMKPSASMLGMSVRLIFQNKGLVAITDKLSPVLGGLLSNVLGSGNVSVEKTGGAIHFNIVSPLVGLMPEFSGSDNQIQSSLSLYGQQDTEVLSLFESPSTTILDKNIPTRKPNTIAVFYSQGPEVNSMVGLPVAQEGSGMVAMQGSIYLDERDALVVEFGQK